VHVVPFSFFDQLSAIVMVELAVLVWSANAPLVSGILVVLEIIVIEKIIEVEIGDVVLFTILTVLDTLVVVLGINMVVLPFYCGSTRY